MMMLQIGACFNDSHKLLQFGFFITKAIHQIKDLFSSKSLSMSLETTNLYSEMIYKQQIYILR